MTIDAELHNRVAGLVTQMVWNSLREAEADTTDLLILMETITCHLLLLAGREAPEEERLRFEAALWEALQANVPKRLDHIRAHKRQSN